MDIIIPSAPYPLTQVLRNVWLGNCGDAEKLFVENPLSIAVVINVSGIKYNQREGVTYLDQYSWEDGKEIPEELFWAVVYFGAKTYEEDINMMIHCAAGMSRSPAMLAAIMHWSKVLEFDRALTFIQRKRPIIRPHHKIIGSIRKHLKLYPYDGTYPEDSRKA